MELESLSLPSKEPDARILTLTDPDGYWWMVMENKKNIREPSDGAEGDTEG